jgi:hypothetical protein
MAAVDSPKIEKNLRGKINVRRTALPKTSSDYNSLVPRIFDTRSRIVNTREELYLLDEEQRHFVIAEMSIKHHMNEINAGHVNSDGSPTKDYKHHHIPEIDAAIFKYECEPYSFGLIRNPENKSNLLTM